MPTLVPRFASSPAVFAAALLAAFATGPSLAQPAASGAQHFADLGACKLVSGQSIAACRLGYRTWGALNAARSNAILFPTWFSGSSHDIAGYVGPDKMLDPGKYFIVAIDALGDGISCSPSNSTAQPGPLFPAFTTEDMVRAEHRLATEVLHLDHVRAVMGISMGGMQTFEWMVDYPAFMDEAIPIVGSPRLTGHDLLLWHSEADALRSDPAWRNGYYTQPPPMGAVDALHQMNLTTPAHYARENPPATFPSVYAGYYSKGILPFDANNWLYQLEAMIHHDVAHGGAMADAEKRVKAHVLVVVAAQDHMVNPGPAEGFAKAIGARTFILESDCGHISTGCEIDKLAPAVQQFLEEK